MFKELLRQNSGTDLRFVIAGTGPDSYRLHLKTLIAELGLSGLVLDFGPVSDEVKRQLYAASDIFLGPCDTIEESFGLTPIEAMASGLPQVVADWDGYRDTVSHGETGFLIPTLWASCDESLHGTSDALGLAYDYTIMGQAVCLDIAQMITRLRELIQNTALRKEMSEKSRRRAVYEFSYQSVAKKYEELYRELLLIKASTLAIDGRTATYKGPAYYETFRHYATAELADYGVLERTASMQSVAAVMRGVAPSITGSIPMFSEELLEGILSGIPTAAKSGQTVTVGCISEFCKQFERESATVRRHILFLIKHGLLKYRLPRAATFESL